MLGSLPLTYSCGSHVSNLPPSLLPHKHFNKITNSMHFFGLFSAFLICSFYSRSTTKTSYLLTLPPILATYFLNYSSLAISTYHVFSCLGLFAHLFLQHMMWYPRLLTGLLLTLCLSSYVISAVGCVELCNF